MHSTFHPKAFIPWPGIEPEPQQWEHRILTTRPPGRYEPEILLQTQFKAVTAHWNQKVVNLHQDGVEKKIGAASLELFFNQHGFICEIVIDF